MIYCELIDAGTYPLKNPATHPLTPGMDSLYYNEGDFEADGVAPRPDECNAIVRDAGEFELKPWPSKFRNQCWIDKCKRYEFDGDDGLQLNLRRFDRITEETPIVPAGELHFERDSEPELDATAARLVRSLSWKEIQERAERPAEWLRLDTFNETNPNTDLKDPLVAMFRSLRGNEFRLELPDQSLFVPFDLTHPERYRVEDDAGQQLPEEEAAHWMTLKNGGLYRLYFRPRKWRMVITLIVHYTYISGFEYFTAQETFTRAYTHRPPFYPWRHDLLTTNKTTPLSNYFGSPRSYDPAIDWQFSHSRTAGALAREIMEGQYFTKLVAKIFSGNEWPDVIVSSRPAEKGDTVLGIGRVDTATGKETRRWIIQNQDLTHVYPWELLGSYLAFWSVTGVF